MTDMTEVKVVTKNGEVPAAFQVLSQEKGDFTAFDSPLTYRIDLRGANANPQFKAAGIEVGKEFSFVPLNWQIQKGIRPSDEYEEPTDFLITVCFDKNGVLSNFAMNSTNMKDFLEKVAYFQTQAIPAAAVRFTVSPKYVKTRHKFYVLEWSVEPVGEEYFTKMSAFVSENPEVLTAIRLLPNIDAEPQS